MKLGSNVKPTNRSGICVRNCIRAQSGLLPWWSSSNSNLKGTVQTSPDDTSDDAFYGRDVELKKMHELCTGVPTSISVILGPRNSGKTRLLHHFVKTANQHTTPISTTIRAVAAPAAGAAAPPSSFWCHINGRIVCVATPHDMARALQEHSMPAIVQQLEVLGPFMREGAQVATAVAGFVSSMRERLDADPGGSLGNSALSAALETFLLDKAELELKEVLASYHRVLEEFHLNRRQKQSELSAAIHNEQAHEARQQQQQQQSGHDVDMPVLIIDEANVLMQWSHSHPEDLAALLRFFISVTKECNRSHVVLATSDSSFHAWLCKEIGPSFFQSFVVGDFDKAGARQFLDLQLGRQQRETVGDEDWELVHQVCGGNPGALCNAASSYRVLGEWIPALQHVTKDIAGTMWWGMFPPPGAAYTASDYATATQLLLGSHYGGVDQADVLAQLPGGLPSLAAMYKANLLALRPYSDWASDIPAAAFGPGQHYMLVTAPSPIHQYLMRERREQLLKPLEQQQQQQQQHTGSTGKPAPPVLASRSSIGAQHHPASKQGTQPSSAHGSNELGSSSTTASSSSNRQAELSRVQADIANLEAQLTQLQSDLQAVKAQEGSEGGGGALPGEAASLLRGIDQMREEKLQLRKMELLLLQAVLGQQTG